MPFPIRVFDVMSSPVETTLPETSASAAAHVCDQEGIGSLVVVENGEIVGIVTSSDFVGLLGEGDRPEERPIREFMSSDVITIGRDATVGEAVTTMFQHGIARLVVVEDGALVGLISTDDVARHVPQVFQRGGVEHPEPPEFYYHTQQETAFERPDWEFEAMSVEQEVIRVGDRVRFSKTISEDDVRAFAEASGDTNRLHLDDEYAEDTRFGRRIAHGTLVGGLLSAALARLPV